MNMKLSFSKCHWIPGIKISDQNGELLKTHISGPISYFLIQNLWGRWYLCLKKQNKKHSGILQHSKV